MEEILTESSFEQSIKERFLRQPISLQVVELVFNYVNGGYEAVDNANLNDEEIKEIIIKIQEVTKTMDDVTKSFDDNKIRQIAKEIDSIIDIALER